MSWGVSGYVKTLTRLSSGQRLTRTEKFVLLMIADEYRDQFGDAWISLGKLAEVCLISVRGLCDTLASLESKGLLHIAHRKDPKRGYLANVYTFPGYTARGRATEVTSEGVDCHPTEATSEASNATSVPTEATSQLPSSSPSSSDLFKNKKDTVGLSPDDRGNLWSVAEGILDFLNRKTGKHYQPRRPNKDPTTSLKSVHGLLKAGYQEQQLRQVIGNRLLKWGDDPKMQEFLRPETLFRPSKFEQYLGELGRA